MDNYSSSANQYQATPNSTNAIISLVSGILGLTLIPIIGSIAALIVGYIARKEIRESNGTIGGESLATTGIVLGWIGVGLAILGCCVFGTIFLIPACLIPLGITLDQYSFLLSQFISLI